MKCVSTIICERMSENKIQKRIGTLTYCIKQNQTFFSMKLYKFSNMNQIPHASGKSCLTSVVRIS